MTMGAETKLWKVSIRVQVYITVGAETELWKVHEHWTWGSYYSGHKNKTLGSCWCVSENGK